ncbi:MAG TPA: hypothetical protein VHM01_06415 [Alphaproteobacteria bacterium]|nr:hypothetical protein [Alphaproteobacteria bacterium]
MFAGLSWAARAGQALSLGTILISLLYYNPKIMLERRPTLID